MAKKIVCLNMIVKNESKVIRRCLDSVKTIIDHWVIVDTGSSDGTQGVIKEVLKDIRGELHERPWVNFEHNRNGALELARGHGDYFLFMDADDWLVFSGMPGLPPLSDDYYLCPSRHGRRIFQFVLLVNGRLNWKYVGLVHEGVVCPEAKSWGVVDHVFYQISNEGSRSKDPKAKFLSDANILETDLGRLSKSDPLRGRYLIHLAESYEFAGEYEKALLHYEKRAAAPDGRLEFFFALYRMGVLQEKLGMPASVFLKSYLKAYRCRPSRAEPLFCLARYYMKIQCYQLGYLFSGLALRTANTDDYYDNETEINEYGLLCQMAECAAAIGKYAEAYEAMQRLLAVETLPLDIRKETEKNIQVFKEWKR